MSQQMLGVLQPRPVSTLHVGGGLKTDGAISAQSLGVTGNATVSGTLGVTGATTLSTLGVTGATTLAALTAGTTRLGQLNVGAGATSALAGDVAASRDSSPTTGVYYFGNTGGKYLYYDGSNFQLTGGRLNGQLTAGMAQQLLGSFFQTTSYFIPGGAGYTWRESTVQLNVTFTGVPVRVEYSLCISVNNTFIGVNWGIGLNGSLLQNLGYEVWDNNVVRTVSGCTYFTPAAGAARVSMFIMTDVGCGLTPTVASSMYVTEQRC